MVLQVATRGIERAGETLQVAAGESWDAFVATCVAAGLSGVECLSGIPGSVGATPIQNVGAYGQEVAATISSVRALDRRTNEVVDLSPAECGFGYRSSVFKRKPGRWLILRVTFALEESAEAEPLRYAELIRALDAAIGDRPPLAAVREQVLALRRDKGMVLDPEDPDTRSAGSFFTNPVLSTDAFAALGERVRGLLGADTQPPAFPDGDDRVKTSAAWLIERAGFTKGQGDPEGIAISAKHVLALTNRGAGSTDELVAFAGRIIDQVREVFGVTLEPEPVLVGRDWSRAPGA